MPGHREDAVRVSVVGGGTSGRAIERALVARGATTELFSRATGFDVRADDAPARLGSADVIVEATGQFTMRRTVAVDFFTRSTRAVAAAARMSGARHVLLSIVNCELAEVQGYGYFAGKAAQEQIARAESENLTVVRSTQWFEFARQSLDRMRIGPVAFVPRMTIRPVALDAVAAVIAECATGARAGASYEIAGPDVRTLWEMTTQLPDTRVTPVPVALPGRLGRAFRDGTLVPGNEAETAGPRFSDWVRTIPAGHR